MHVKTDAQANQPYGTQHVTPSVEEHGEGGECGQSHHQPPDLDHLPMDERPGLVSCQSSVPTTASTLPISTSQASARWLTSGNCSGVRMYSDTTHSKPAGMPHKGRLCRSMRRLRWPAASM